MSDTLLTSAYQQSQEGEITRMIEDVIAESRRRIVDIEPDTVDDVRQAGRPLVGFSVSMAQADRAIKDFLYPRFYRQARIAKIMAEAEGVVRRLYGHYLITPEELPAEWLAGLDPGNAPGRAVSIADFIAGMTDRYAIIEYMRLFGEAPELR